MTATLKDIRDKTEHYFISKKVPNAKLDTDLIIAHCLGIQRLEIYLDLERPIYEKELDNIRECVRRRGKREPLQYILGFTEVFNCQIKVDSRALIPRQETEYMIELCMQLIGEQARVLDLGTGSGVIALALAKAFPKISVLAIDQSLEALALAKENASALALNERVDFLMSDWFSKVPQAETFDLIVANPPYLSQSDLKTAEPEVTEFEPTNALVSEEGGLLDLKRIIQNAPNFLAEKGWLVLETGIEHEAILSEFANALGYVNISCENDLENRPRFLLLQI